MLKCCLQDHEGKYVEYQPNLVPERKLTKHSHSAGMVFEANKATGDYHDNMDGHVFMLWVKHKFLPTMLKKGNKKKIVLVLVNKYTVIIICWSHCGNYNAIITSNACWVK